ncbi:hypothetical protein Tco_1316882 [Tanacetum coccineum]
MLPMFSLVWIMPPRVRTRSVGQPVTESRGRGTSVQVGRGGRGKRPREGNDERVDDLNGQGNNQGLGANGGVEGVNRNVDGANGGAPDFSAIIAQQLQNLLPVMIAQEKVGNVIVNGNQVGCSYKEFLACNPKEYDGKGGAVVLTRKIKKECHQTEQFCISLNLMSSETPLFVSECNLLLALRRVPMTVYSHA